MPSSPSTFKSGQPELQVLGNLLQVQRVRKPGGTQIVQEVSANLGSRICGATCFLHRWNQLLSAKAGYQS